MFDQINYKSHPPPLPSRGLKPRLTSWGGNREVTVGPKSSSLWPPGIGGLEQWPEKEQPPLRDPGTRGAFPLPQPPCTRGKPGMGARGGGHPSLLPPATRRLCDTRPAPGMGEKAGQGVTGRFRVKGTVSHMKRAAPPNHSWWAVHRFRPRGLKGPSAQQGGGRLEPPP